MTSIINSTNFYPIKTPTQQNNINKNKNKPKNTNNKFKALKTVGKLQPHSKISPFQWQKLQNRKKTQKTIDQNEQQNVCSKQVPYFQKIAKRVNLAEGCTPSNLLELFKKPIPQSSKTAAQLPETYNFHCHSTKDLNISTDHVANQFPILSHQFSSSLSQPRNSSNNSFSQIQDIVSVRKFRIFFKTILNGMIDEETLSILWKQFQESVSNPFTYDKFIQRLHQQRQATQTLNQRNRNMKYREYKHKSVENGKSRIIDTRKNKSLQKGKEKVQGRQQMALNLNEKAQMRSEIRKLKSIINQGQKYIRSKK